MPTSSCAPPPWQGHLLRKPVDLTLERARQCAAAVKEAGVACLIGFQRRYDPTFAAAKARIEAGEIGQPEVLVVTSRDPVRRRWTTSSAPAAFSRTC
jgi:predicted dehydrogenase